jgi:hypothetical protein
MPYIEEERKNWICDCCEQNPNPMEDDWDYHDPYIEYGKLTICWKCAKPLSIVMMIDHEDEIDFVLKIRRELEISYLEKEAENYQKHFNKCNTMIEELRKENV